MAPETCLQAAMTSVRDVDNAMHCQRFLSTLQAILEELVVNWHAPPIYLMPEYPRC